MKSNKQSATYRASGNEFYKKKKFHEALVEYNKCLCHASVGSENAGLGYANRSAVYLEMKMVEKCLRNIEMAMGCEYPKENIEILTKRREKCRAMTKQELKVVNSFEFFKLSYKENPRTPFIIDGLQVNINGKYGKHIVAIKNLRVGDIVAVEKPFFSILLSQSNFVEVDSANKFQRCSKCLIDNQLDLVPCGACCDAMFCSIKCQQEAMKSFHRYECSVMPQLLKSGSTHIALRIFFVALSAFEGSIEKLQKFIEKNDKTNSTVFDFDFSIGSSEETKNFLKCFGSLSRNSKVFPLQTFGEILSNHSELRSIWITHENFIKDFLQKTCQTNDLYFHGIFSGSLKQNHSNDPLSTLKSLQQPIGSGWFPFCSLINHSCSPNVIRIYVEGQVVLIICRPIEKNSQLFDCYKASFNREPKAQRQSRLLREFLFKCDCEACVSDFPSPPHLNYKDIKLLKFAKKVENEVTLLKPKQIMKRFRECCDALELSNNNFPSLEMSLLQKCFVIFLLKQAAPFSLP